MTMLNPAVVLVFSTFATSLMGKQFDKCELAEVLRLHFEPGEIDDWLCLIEGESQFNSSAIGTLNLDGSKDLGLFQLSDKFWCKWEKLSILGCGVKCTSFIDDDITDDIRCAKKVFKEHKRLSGNGFNAWAAWKHNCAGKDLSSFSGGCNRRWSISPDFQPGIRSPLNQQMARSL